MTATVPPARRRRASAPSSDAASSAAPLTAPAPASAGPLSATPGSAASGSSAPSSAAPSSAAPSSAGPATVATPGTGSAAPPGGRIPERLAALLAETGAGTAAPAPAASAAAASVRAPSGGPEGPGAAPAHRRQVAARTRVPRSLLLLALAAVTGLAWTVLGPGRDGAGGPDAAVLAEAELDAGPPDGSAHGGAAGPDTASGAEPTVPGPTGLPEPSSPPWPSPGPTLYVHVTGEVARPGVVSVAGGARVVDAVEAAGGLTDGAATDAVNLAAPVTDGQQVLVPGTDATAAPAVPGAPAAAGAGNPAAPPAVGPAAPGATPGGPPGPLDLNTATAAELESLPRVGPVLAGRIVEFRQQNGGFTAVTDLDAVPGIGPALMDALVPLVTV